MTPIVCPYCKAGDNPTLRGMHWVRTGPGSVRIARCPHWEKPDPEKVLASFETDGR